MRLFLASAILLVGSSACIEKLNDNAPAELKLASAEGGAGGGFGGDPPEGNDPGPADDSGPLATIEVIKPSSMNSFLVQVAIPCDHPAVCNSGWVKQDRTPVQKEPISRRPDGMVDVWQAIFPVTSTAPAGSPIQLTLYYGDNGIGTPPTIPSIDLSQIRYELRVDGVASALVAGVSGQPVVLRDGRYLREERYYDQFEGGGHKILGIHTFVTRRSDSNVALVNVMINNGNIYPNWNGVNGNVYFRDIKMFIGSLGATHQVMPNVMRVSMGNLIGGIDLVKALPGTQKNYMPYRSHFHRRLAIHADPLANEARSLLDKAGYGRAVSGNSFYDNFAWGAQKGKILRYTNDFQYNGTQGLQGTRTWDTNRRNALRGLLQTGGQNDSHHVFTGNLGWAHPLGRNLGYEHGGWAIAPFEGYHNTVQSLRLIELWMAMVAERNPIALIHPDTGNVTSIADMAAANGGESPVDVHLTGGNVAQLPAFENAGGMPWNSGNSPYDGALENYDRHDAAHAVRGTKDAKALVYAANDGVAKFILEMAANHLRFDAPDFPIETIRWRDNSLMDSIMDAQPNPNQGGGVGRRQAWPMEAMALAYATGTDGFRASAINWFNLYATYIATIMPVHAILQRGRHPVTWSPSPYDNGLDPSFDAAQTFEAGLVSHATWSLYKSVFQGVDVGRATTMVQQVVTSARKINELQRPTGVGNTPPKFMVVAMRDGDPLDPMPMLNYSSDAAHPMFHLTYACRATGDSWYLDRARNFVDVGAISQIGPELLGQASSGWDRLQYAIELISFSQDPANAPCAP